MRLPVLIHAVRRSDCQPLAACPRHWLSIICLGTMKWARALALLLGLAPGATFACACGCEVFDVGTAAMIQTKPGGMVFIEDDYLDQDQNWVDSKAAPASANTDRKLQTQFGGLGLE